MKINQIKKHTIVASYPDTYRNIIDNIPIDIWDRLNSKQLAKLVDLMFLRKSNESKFTPLVFRLLYKKIPVPIIHSFLDDLTYLIGGKYE